MRRSIIPEGTLSRECFSALFELTCFVSAATFGPVDCLSTRLFLDGPKIAEEFEVNARLCGTGSLNRAQH